MAEQKITSIKRFVPSPSTLPVMQASTIKTISELLSYYTAPDKFCEAFTMKFGITIWGHGAVVLDVDGKDGVKAELTVPIEDFLAVLDRLGFDFKQEEGGES